MSIMDLKKNAPKGEFLAYINKEEAAMLKKAGGSGKLVNGIPSFRPEDFGQEAKSKEKGFDQSNKNNPYSDASQKAQAAENKSISDRHAQRQRDAIKAELAITPFNRNKPLNKFQLFNNQYQKKANIKLAQRRAFQKYQDIEKYADIMDDYGLSAEDLAKEVAANPSYGYDFSNLEEGKSKLGSNIGTSIEKYRENLYDVNSNIPGRAGIIGNFLANKVRPDTQVTAKNTLQKARDYNTLVGNPNLTRQDIIDLGNRGKLPEQINPPSGGDGPRPLIPINYNTGAATIEDAEPYNQFTYRMGDPAEAADVTRASYIFNKGGRVPAMEGGIMGLRARRAFGGIMDRVTGRKAYGLGSIFKSVKKAASKVLKSDIGKAALLYAGGVYLGGGNMFQASSYNPARFFGSKASGGYFANMGGGLSSLGKKFGFEKLGPNASLGDKAMKYAKLFGVGKALTMIPGLNTPKVDQMPGGGRRGSDIKNSQGVEGSAAITEEIQEAFKSGDPQRIAAVQEYYNYMLPNPGAVQDLNNLPSTLPYKEFGKVRAAEGGRIGFNDGGTTITLMDGTTVKIPSGSYNSSGGLKDKIYSSSKGDLLREEIIRKLSFANGGRIGKAEGGLLDLGGMEKDYRAEGGFVPIGEYEKKDDVPARLSVNEFVFTADAVRGAGQGDIDKGAEIMENMMENLENGGTVSEESQGNKGAQQMFETSQRLGEVV